MAPLGGDRKGKRYRLFRPSSGRRARDFSSHGVRPVNGSRSLRLGVTLQTGLAGSGLPNPFAGPWRLDDAEQYLSRGLLEFARALNKEGMESETE